MKTRIGIAMLVTFATLNMCGTVAASTQGAQEPKPVDRSNQTAAADDNMTPYRTLAAATLKAFQAHDMATAKKKAKELESAWDNGEKALQKKSPDVWDQIDKAMDDFIKPLQDKSPDAAKVQKSYDTFIAKLQLAVKSDGAR